MSSPTRHETCESLAPEEAARLFSGEIGVWARHLNTGETISFNSDGVFETASCIKVPIMLEVLRQAGEGRFGLDDPLPFREEHRVLGSGILRDLSSRVVLTVRDAVVLMIVVSDNSATNMLIDLVDLDAVNETLRSLGLRETVLHNRISFQEDAPDRLGSSTPREFGVLLEKVYRRLAVSPAACEQAIDIMKRQQYNQAIARYLPYDLIAPPHREGEKRVVEIASKSGSWTGVRNDAGIVFTPWGDYVVSLWSKGCKDERYHVDQEAMVILPAVSRWIFDRFVGARASPRPPH